MKNITRTRIYLPMAAMALAFAFAGVAAAQAPVPLKGTIQGSDNVTEPANMATSGAGNATLLGKFSYRQNVTLNFEAFTDSGTAEWTAANGDTLTTTVAGAAIPGEVSLSITEIHVITGGTGRFAGAQGTITVRRIHIYALSDDGTHVTFGWFEGSISSPGGAQ